MLAIPTARRLAFTMGNVRTLPSMAGRLASDVPSS
jgi:hypothetical protein